MLKIRKFFITIAVMITIIITTYSNFSLFLSQHMIAKYGEGKFTAILKAFYTILRMKGVTKVFRIHQKVNKIKRIPKNSDHELPRFRMKSWHRLYGFFSKIEN